MHNNHSCSVFQGFDSLLIGHRNAMTDRVLQEILQTQGLLILQVQYMQLLIEKLIGRL
jgi:hypothetical protein